jgi:hypothetical protein
MSKMTAGPQTRVVLARKGMLLDVGDSSSKQRAHSARRPTDRNQSVRSAQPQESKPLKGKPDEPFSKQYNPGLQVRKALEGTEYEDDDGPSRNLRPRGKPSSKSAGGQSSRSRGSQQSARARASGSSSQRSGQGAGPNGSDDALERNGAAGSRANGDTSGSAAELTRRPGFRPEQESLMFDALDLDMPGRLKPTETLENQEYEGTIYFADWEGYDEGFVKRAVQTLNTLGVRPGKQKPLAG